MKRLVCVVEGHGDVNAVPNLVARLLKYLEAWDWGVDADPVRQPRSHLVDESIPAPRRPPNTDGLSRALELALLRKPSAVVVVVDEDDDCAAFWGPPTSDAVRHRVVGAGVMAVREFESWLLWSRPQAELMRARINPHRVRDAKGALKKLVPGYLPTCSCRTTATANEA